MSRLVFLGVFIIFGIAITYFFMMPKEKPLPVINPIDVKSEMVDSSVLRKGYGHRIGNFRFLDQFGDSTGSEVVKDKIYVVEYFFTTCKTICPVMNKSMQRVQKAFLAEDDVKLLSFTVDPETDSVEQIKRFADAHGAVKGKWYFFTGKKEALYALARKSFFVLKPAEAQNLGDAGSDFIHTNNLVLVDRDGSIRGYYDGTSSSQVGKLIEDISRLLQE